MMLVVILIPSRCSYVGRVCDNIILLYEDPYKDGGVSINGNRVLFNNLKTPIMVGNKEI